MKAKPKHYEGKIEPWDFIMQNNIPWAEGNIIKYAFRWRKKGEGVADLEKIITIAQKLIDEEKKTNVG